MQVVSLKLGLLWENFQQTEPEMKQYNNNFGFY